MRWQKLPEFSAAYLEARRASFKQAAARLQQGTSAAATTLLKTMIDPAAPASVRVRAAEAIFNHVKQAIELEDVEARVSFSTVAHLRWDLRQILRMATQEGCIARNPAELLFVPREATRRDSRVMSSEEVMKCLAAICGRAGLVVRLSILGGLRPGEILALRCGRVKDGYVEISERVYRNDLDTPKSRQSVRKAALPEQLNHELLGWIAGLPDSRPEAWVFPSEKGTTPVTKDNLWRREIQPKLAAIGLDWVNFQVFRRTHATLMRGARADPKLVADNMGHTVDVNQNFHTQTPIDMRKQAVEAMVSMVTVQ